MDYVYLVLAFDIHDKLLCWEVAQEKTVAQTIKYDFEQDADYAEIHYCNVVKEY